MIHDRPARSVCVCARACVVCVRVCACVCVCVCVCGDNVYICTVLSKRSQPAITYLLVHFVLTCLSMQVIYMYVYVLYISFTIDLYSIQCHNYSLYPNVRQ